jgi:hypothetical protein
MSRIHPDCLDPETEDGSVDADVLLRQEPDEEEDEEEDEGDGKDDDDDEETDDGYSELNPPGLCTSSQVLGLRSGK